MLHLAPLIDQPDKVLIALMIGLASLLAVGAGSGLANAPAPDRARAWRDQGLYAVCAGVCAAVGALALYALIADIHADLRLPIGVPWIGVNVHLDPLAAVFLGVISGGGCATSVFAIGYRAKSPGGRAERSFYPAFLAAMSLVVLAADAFTFLLAWEAMSLLSWGLLMSGRADAPTRRAGYVYLIMASFGGTALLLAFGLMSGASGVYDFSGLRSLGSHPTTGWILVLTLIGAGSKAGLLPFHVWLPLAHPAAPSHVSALMSGVMTKVAVYAFIRIAFDLLGPPQWGWGALLIIIGAATAVMGVLFALWQDDLKRLLAYSTLENLGVIFLALGLALAFKADGLTVFAALALTAAILHVVFHATFKTLLFLGAGAVQSATGRRDLDGLGGLLRLMPRTGLAFLIGAGAISALPPLNGFVSEWLIFQAVLVSPALTQWPLKILAPAAGVLMALAAALAAACFVRAFGIGFLGRARSEEAASAQDVDVFQTTALLTLAALCVCGGLAPGLIVDALSGTVREMTGGGRLPLQMGQVLLRLAPLSAARSSYDGLFLVVFITGAAVCSAATLRLVSGARTRRAPAWACGSHESGPTAQYTGSSFAQPLRRVFGGALFAAREQISMPEPGALEPARFQSSVHDLIWELVYVPLARGVGWVADLVNPLQFLTIRQYLTWVVATLVVALSVISVWR